MRSLKITLLAAVLSSGADLTKDLTFGPAFGKGVSATFAKADAQLHTAPKLQR